MGQIIPQPGGGRAKGGLKASAGKEEMIRICITALGVVRILHNRNVISQVAERDLELYIRAMENAKNDAIADFFFDRDSDLNKKSLKMPLGEQGRGYLEGGATLPIARFQKCAACAY